MNKSFNYTRLQLNVLVLLRLLVGWHLFYEGLSKLLNPAWTSAGFLLESNWIFSGFAHWIASNPVVLNAADFLNTWGLLAIGTGLILGLFTRIASVSGAVLLLIYYLVNPPVIGMENAIPAEGNYLIINKTLIESFTLVLLTVFPTGSVFGLDLFLARIRKTA